MELSLFSKICDGGRKGQQETQIWLYRSRGMGFISLQNIKLIQKKISLKAHLLLAQFVKGEAFYFI